MSSINGLPSTFRRIEMALAREPGHPAGDRGERYILIAPLDGDGKIDAQVWKENREACRVVREHEGETAVGHLARGPGGIWRFEYDVSGDAESERAFHLEDEHILTGEYISIVREDGAHPYRVMAVAPV